MVTLEDKMAHRGRIEVEQDEDGSIIISDAVTLNYGVGKSPVEAQAFINALRDYTDSLEEWWILTRKEREKP